MTVSRVVGPMSAGVGVTVMMGLVGIMANLAATSAVLAAQGPAALCVAADPKEFKLGATLKLNEKILVYGPHTTLGAQFDHWNYNPDGDRASLGHPYGCKLMATGTTEPKGDAAVTLLPQVLKLIGPVVVTDDRYQATALEKCVGHQDVFTRQYAFPLRSQQGTVTLYCRVHPEAREGCPDAKGRDAELNLGQIFSALAPQLTA